MKDIFSGNSDINKTAFMNWRTEHYNHIHNMLVIAEGFRDSALLLAEELLKDNSGKRADNIIFPILFNANHSIEVYLKAICWTQYKLLNRNDTFYNTHNLEILLKTVVDLEKELDSSIDKKGFDDKLKDLNAYIVELYAKIERIVIKNGKNKKLHDITFSRYTLNNDLEPQFYINTFENVEVDLENFQTVFKGIFDNLDSLAAFYAQRLEGKLENEYEARQIQAEIESEFRGE